MIHLFFPSPNLIGFPHRRRTLFPELRSPTRSLSPQTRGEEFMSYSSIRRGAGVFGVIWGLALPVRGCLSPPGFSTSIEPLFRRICNPSGVRGGSQIRKTLLEWMIWDCKSPIPCKRITNTLEHFFLLWRGQAPFVSQSPRVIPVSWRWGQGRFTLL